MSLWCKFGIGRFCWKSKVITFTVSLLFFGTLLEPDVWIFPDQLCIAAFLSSLLLWQPESPPSWCSLSSFWIWVSLTPPDNCYTRCKASHLAHVSLLGSPKLKLNSELKMWRYMNNESSGLRKGGAATLFSCLHLCKNRRLMLTVNRKTSGWLIQHELATFFAVKPCNAWGVFSIFESSI